MGPNQCIHLAAASETMTVICLSFVYLVVVAKAARLYREQKTSNDGEHDMLTTSAPSPANLVICSAILSLACYIRLAPDSLCLPKLPTCPTRPSTFSSTSRSCSTLRGCVAPIMTLPQPHLYARPSSLAPVRRRPPAAPRTQSRPRAPAGATWPPSPWCLGPPSP